MTHGYLLGAELGAGGTGRVYAATRTWDGRAVALKLLHPALARDPVARRTIVTEALATATLAHASIASVLDLDEHAAHGIFIVSELATGSPLRKLLDAGQARARSLEILRDVAAALCVAHAAGVVHGDLKPGNVMVAADGAVKVCDFGIAQVMAPTARGAARREAAGTPRYMAPEQFVSGLALDPRTDVYAMGVMLYEVVYGESPFPRNDMAAMVNAKLQAIVPPRADADGRSVSIELRHFLGRALQPNVRQRPRFAADVVEAIERALVASKAPPSARAAERQTPALASVVEDDAEGTIVDPWTMSEEALTRLVDVMREVAAPPAGALPNVPRATVVATSHVPGTGLVHLRPPPFVGRVEERRSLRHAADEALRERRTVVRVITGPPGSGKSRLAEWLCAWAESSGTLEPAVARFSSHAGRNASGLRAMLSALFAPSAPDVSAAVRATSEWIAKRSGRGVPDEETLAVWLASSTTDAADPHGTASFALGAACAYASARPLVLWFDDLSLAEDGSIELVARLAAERPAVPILVVVTTADDAFEEPSFRVRSGLGGADVAPLRLADLGLAERTQVLAALLPLRPGFAEALASDLGGSPLVLVQRAEQWVESGLLAYDADGLAPVVDREELVRAVDSDALVDERVARHLSRSPSARALELLAILGPFADGGALLAACERVGVEASRMDLAIEEALCRGLLRARADEVSYAHGALRAGVLRRAFRDPDYPRLAAAAAAALSEAARERPSVQSYVAVLLRDAGEIVEALRRLMQAAETMAWGADFDQAQRQLAVLHRWVAEMPDVPLAIRDEVALTEARIAYFQDDLGRVRRVLDELIERVRGRDQESPLYPAMLTLSANTHFFADEIPACEAVLATLRREVPESLDPLTPIGGRTTYIECNLAALRDDFDAAAAAYARVLDNGLPRLRWVARLELAELSVARGDHPAAAQYLERLRTECGTLDVYQLRAIRQRQHAFALARGERRDRHLYEETVRAQGSDWYRTSALVALALWDATFDLERLPASALDALDAFARRPHDEALTHAFLVRVRNVLRSAGHAQLAARATMLLAERAAIARAT